MLQHGMEKSDRPAYSDVSSFCRPLSRWELSATPRAIIEATEMSRSGCNAPVATSAFARNIDPDHRAFVAAPVPERLCILKGAV